ncbi:hypothetical protein SAMN02910451_03043 [Butyrivibrio hungatei]|uniref:Uncharacterized protein n=1 Tax=Butyrivibrio hungatei TaxID=185008 RepID=A0A1G5GTT0_9FIRM|nr:hypothetical protein [Butyrivibrio hungatei]SCY54801.1 hypothetical protein SAMN02910451_03043 [Butyrivibrio hungatei]
MEYVVIAFIVGVVLAVIIGVLIRNRKKEGRVSETSKRNSLEIRNESSLQVDSEMITNLSEIDETKLVEIKDSKLLARLDNVIPNVAQAVANTGAAKAYKNATEAAGQLYKAIIPKGAVLDNSRDMKGAFRASYREVANRIEGNANLVPVDSKAADGLAKLSSASAVMNVASMVVGQYYMTQINDQLTSISAGIDKIVDFQQKEYKSKVLALVAGIQKLAIFQVETIENYELRNRELSHLKNLEHECAELLGQANLTLQAICGDSDIDYSTYEDKAKEAEQWFRYQQILVKVMDQISDLTYALNLGAISRKNSCALMGPYAKQANDTLVKLNEWHNRVCKKLEINTDEQRRKRQGIEGFFMSALGAFNDDLNYKKVSDEMIHRIENQTDKEVLNNDSRTDLFQEDVNLIVKDGKVFYLPQTG